ncbi:MAG: type II secretion system protein GspL [Pseudomonadales bacterium]|nr:type II secretion system protein GspL [Pseudomonadales bacterium]
MPNRLYLRVSRSQVEWLAMDETSGEVQIRGQGSLEDFAERTVDMQWTDDPVVMLTADTVRLTSANVPSRQMRQILQAVPFAVEEQLAEDVEDCHFAVGDRLDNGELRVAVINREYYAGLREQLQALGIKPVVVTVETDHLFDPAHTTVMVDGADALIAGARGQAYRFRLDQLSLIAALLLKDDTPPLRVLVHEEKLQDTDLLLTQLRVELEQEIPVESVEWEGFEYLCRHQSGSAINLQQGEFRVQVRKQRKTSVWRNAANVAGVAFSLHTAAMFGQGYFLSGKAQAYEDEARELYKAVFPGDRNVRDLRRSWRSHLSSGGDNGSDFMALFSSAAQSLPGSNLVLQNINYNESRGDLILQIEAPRSEQLVLFSQTLSRAGLEAEIGTISQEEDRVRGSIKIKAFGNS